MANSRISEAVRQIGSAVLRHDGATLTDGQLLETFLRGRDPAALEALVRRHAGMVWAVCRRTLPNEHDAADAFQATFLVLVRRAGSVVPRELVGNWLYGVARRTALKARANAARRKMRERPLAGTPEPAAATSPDARDDLRSILDRELGGLPEKYRVAIVLCDLEGKTRQEAAGCLGVPEGTVASRLARAREMLAVRLTGRVALSAGAIASLLPQEASAGVPVAVLGETVRAAGLSAAGTAAAAGVIPARVAALASGVMNAMFLDRLKTVAVVLLLTGMVALGAGLLARHAWAHDGEPEKPATPAEPKRDGGKGRPDDGKGRPRAADDKAKLQGEWALRSQQVSDPALGKRGFVEFTVRVEGEKWLWRYQGTGDHEWQFKVDASAEPQRVDFRGERERSGGKREEFSRLGIYKLEGDVLTVCISQVEPAQERLRPTDFTAKDGSGRWLLVLERVKKKE